MSIIQFLLSLFIPKEPTKTLKPCSVIGINEASSILLDKLEEIGDEHAEIYLPDTSIKTYLKADVSKSYELEEVSSLKYSPDFDCDDFAAELYGKFAGLVWTTKHALCWFISEDEEFFFIEPQSGKISKTLEGWQGGSIRFFLSR